jgi:hypothetical protein
MALAVSPARATLVAPAARSIEVRNTGRETAVVEVAPDVRPWLRVTPARLVLRTRSQALLTVRARAAAHSRPGDHDVVLLLTARPVGSSRIAVRMRLGIRLRVRMPGRLVHGVALRRLRVRRHAGERVLLLAVANTGNVSEQLRGATVTLVRSGRIVSTLRARGAREIPAGSRLVLAFPFAGRVHGLVTADVAARFAIVRTAQRRYRLRL